MSSGCMLLRSKNITIRRRSFNSSGLAAKSLFTRSAMVFFWVVRLVAYPETVVALSQGDGLIDILVVEGGDVLRLLIFGDGEVALP